MLWAFIAFYIGAVIADLYTTRLAESRGALEGNPWLRRDDYKMSLWKALVFKSAIGVACISIVMVDLILACTALGLFAAGQVFAAIGNYRIYRR